ncbi:MAG: GNAT family N-acetyltransferase [Actinomycetota bacterium]|nr:GNAT family N-acetyltransferase [Actinomycetota bacterium]
MTSEARTSESSRRVTTAIGEPEPTASDRGSASLELAQQAAHGAAEAAGVSVRSVGDLAELKWVARLCAEIWQGGSEPPLTTELLRAFDKAGNYVAGAFDGPDLVGACVGFFSAPTEHALHSHIAGVAREVRSRNVGFALKLHQRAWAIQRDVAVIEWTYDPLVARNAHVNITKLGARPVEYLPNFYGTMHDVINSGEDTDRLLVHWMLNSPAVAAAATGRSPTRNAVSEDARGAVKALDVNPRGGPAAGRSGGEVSLVAVPADIEQLRVSDPALAREWRVAVRDSLVGLMAEGGRITGFDRAGWYVVER